MADSERMANILNTWYCSVFTDEDTSHPVRSQSFLAQHELLRLLQHGFSRRRSTLTNLLEYLEKLTSMVDSGLSLDGVYLDFSNAFDKVSIQRLLRKIQGLGMEIPRSGSKAEDGEKREKERKKERLNDGNNYGQAMHGARKLPGPISL